MYINSAVLVLWTSKSESHRLECELMELLQPAYKGLH